MKARNLKMLIVSCIYLACNQLQAISLNCDANIRGKKKKIVQRSVLLNDLTSKTHFTGKYFKIVQLNKNEAIAIDSDLSLRACTAYYHLSIAREYFIKNFDLAHLKKPRAITIRIENSFLYNNATHFSHQNLGKSFNNALTIPPSDQTKLDEVNPWYYEIWFAPKKKIKIKSGFQTAAELTSQNAYIAQLLGGITESQASLLIQQWARTGEITTLDLDYHAKSLLLSVGVVALLPKLMKGVSKFFKKTIYLDAGLIPEVIYHEFAHVALAPYLSLHKHSPVVEGVANYFAAMIGQTHSILHRTKKLAKGLDKLSGKNKTRNFDYFMEDKLYAQLNFTFQFLYALKKEWGEKKATSIIFKAIQKLKGITPEFKKDLVPAIADVLKEENSIQENYQLQRIMQSFGI